jgi:hypothetical protein
MAFRPSGLNPMLVFFAGTHSQRKGNYPSALIECLPLRHPNVFTNHQDSNDTPLVLRFSRTDKPSYFHRERGDEEEEIKKLVKTNNI